MVEIGFDLRRLPNHLNMTVVNTSIAVDYIGPVYSSIELDVMIGCATNLLNAGIVVVVDLVVVLVELAVC